MTQVKRYLVGSYYGQPFIIRFDEQGRMLLPINKATLWYPDRGPAPRPPLTIEARSAVVELDTPEYREGE